MMRSVFFMVACLACSESFCQYADSTNPGARDTALPEVTVQAFHTRLLWKAVPAAIATISAVELKRYGNVTMVPVFNAIPGVRMEERSPASYRLSIRGSLLRSPFGVRNVKIYWHDIPLSDAGGNTYLNLLDIDQLTGVELVKGPAASIYGAGTGGVLLLRSDADTNRKTNFSAGITGGSYGLLKEQLGWQHSRNSFHSSFLQSHLQSDGYREQSAMRRDALKWQGDWQNSQQQFTMLVFYTDLYYQTPGGITLAQMDTNPQLSRQAAGALPGAVQQKTAIYNRTFFAGMHHEVKLNGTFDLKTFVLGSNTSFTNPFITNYEQRSEQNLGAGSNLVFSIQKGRNSFQWMNGFEWLHNHSTIDDYGNRFGMKDTVQFKDNIYARQWFVFSQMQYMPGNKWNFTAGISFNNQVYNYRRLTSASPADVTRKINAVFTPRLAVLYRLSGSVSVYVIAAKGFSPPALAEVRPSDGNFYGDLAAESGWNYEAGIKGELFGRRLQFDVAAYFFQLKDAIVRRNNSIGAEYFVNAGGTEQKGIEAQFKYQLIRRSVRLPGIGVWSSYSYQPFRFTEYQQLASHYSGNELTGVPRNILVAGIDLESNIGWYLSTSVNSVSPLPLTDANDAYAAAYQLLQLKMGYRCKSKMCQLTVFAGADNLLNQHYSLGNDINAAGKRYYNPAAGRNVMAGFTIHF